MIEYLIIGYLYVLGVVLVGSVIIDGHEWSKSAVVMQVVFYPVIIPLGIMLTIMGYDDD